MRLAAAESRAGNAAATRAWIERMACVGYRIGTVEYTTILEAFRRRGDAHGVVDTLREMARRRIAANDVTALLAVNACRRSNRVDLAAQALELVYASGGYAGLRAWCNAIACAVGDGAPRFANAWALLARMRVLRPRRRASAIPFNTLMHAYGRVGDRDGALVVFGAMVAGARCRPDVITYNTLLQASASASRSALAAVRRSMQRHRVRPNVRTLTIELRLIASDSAPAAAAGRMRRRCNDDVVDGNDTGGVNASVSTLKRTMTTTRTVTAAAWSEQRMKMVRAIAAVEQRLGRFRLRPDAFFRNVLLDAYARAGASAAAERALKCMQAEHELIPSLIALNTLLKACLVAGDARRALRVFREMNTLHGVTPNDVSFSTAIRCVAGMRAVDERADDEEDEDDDVERGLGVTHKSAEALALFAEAEAMQRALDSDNDDDDDNNNESDASRADQPAAPSTPPLDLRPARNVVTAPVITAAIMACGADYAHALALFKRHFARLSVLQQRAVNEWRAKRRRQSPPAASAPDDDDDDASSPYPSMNLPLDGAALALLRVCGRARRPGDALELVLALKKHQRRIRRQRQSEHAFAHTHAHGEPMRRGAGISAVDQRCYRAFMRGVRETNGGGGTGAPSDERAGSLSSSSLLCAPAMYLFRVETMPFHVPRVRVRF